MGLFDWLFKRKETPTPPPKIEVMPRIQPKAPIRQGITKEEVELRRLEKEIEDTFITLQRALATTRTLWAGSYTPTQVINVTNVLRKIKAKYNEIAVQAVRAVKKGKHPQLTLDAGKLLEAANVFISGLNLIVNEIQARKIKDVNEIVAHLAYHAGKAKGKLDAITLQQYTYFTSWERVQAAA